MKYSIAELEKMIDTHEILPDGSVVRKKYKKLGRKKLKIIKVKKKKIAISNNCICMDCGKVIKTKEQSKHLKECINSHDKIGE